MGITHSTRPFVTLRLTIHYLIVVALSIGKPIGSKYSGIQTSIQHQTIKASTFILMVMSSPHLGVFVVWCDFGPFLAPHFAMRFRQNYNCTTLHFCGHMCGAVRFRVSENHNHTAPHFCSHLCNVVYKIWFETNMFFQILGFRCLAKN